MWQLLQNYSCNVCIMRQLSQGDFNKMVWANIWAYSNFFIPMSPSLTDLPRQNKSHLLLEINRQDESYIVFFL